jgi:Flp pilus assembly protein TadB
MAEPSARSVYNHPPGGIPRYFDRSPYEKAEIAAPGEKSWRLTLYDELARSHFGVLPAELTRAQLEWLAAHVHLRLELEKEERRMHFGAFALVSVLFFLLLPPVVAGTSLALALLELLLFALLVPYVFVYFGYENRVRAMALAQLRLVEALALRDEKEGR